MKKILIFQILLILLPFLQAQEEYNGQTIEEILAMPEEEIDLGIACLVLAKDVYPTLDIEAFDNILDYMTDQVNTLLKGRTGPIERIRMMNTYLYREGWWNGDIAFSYDVDDIFCEKNENRFLNGYLSTRKGSCITMPMLYLVLAERLGWPIRAVDAPSHTFCRYEGIPDGNIEPTGGGGYSSDEKYIADLNIPAKAIKNGVYMRSLSKKEYLASLLVANARIFFEKSNNKKAIYYLELCLNYYPAFAGAHWNLGNYYFRYAETLKADAEQQKEIHHENKSYIPRKHVSRFKDALAKSKRHMQKARELGLVLETREEYLEKQSYFKERSKRKDKNR